MGDVWPSFDELLKFEHSVSRCLADDAFLPRFYERFLHSSDEVRAKFEGIDMTRQSAMLSESLRLVLDAGRGRPGGREHLERIAELHSGKGLAIGAHLYEMWLCELIRTAAATDPEWTGAIEHSWRATLEPCIERMTRRI